MASLQLAPVSLWLVSIAVHVCVCACDVRICVFYAALFSGFSKMVQAHASLRIDLFPKELQFLLLKNDTRK